MRSSVARLPALARRPGTLTPFVLVVAVCLCVALVPARFRGVGSNEHGGANARAHMRDSPPPGSSANEERAIVHQPWSSQLMGASGRPITLRRGSFVAIVDAVSQTVYKVRLHVASSAVNPSESPVTWRRAVDELQQSDDFRSLIHEAISGSPWDAQFWETLPVSSSRLDQPFEFILADAPGLRGMTPDPEPFRQKLAGGSQGALVTAFENLGRDAVLVVPQCAVRHPTSSAPVGAPSTSCDGWRADGAPYAHVAEFMRGAPRAQVHELLRVVGREVEKRVAENGGRLVWVSTSGLGVSWLHVRLDSRPKYYSYAPYKKIDGGGS